MNDENEKAWYRNAAPRLSAILIAVIFPFFAHAQLSVSDMNTGGVVVSEIVDEILGPGNSAVVSNASITGDSRCIGLFLGGNGLGSGVLGFDNGVVLGTGEVIDAVGPNSSDETTGEFFTAGDPFLDSLIPFEITFDACVLEFDFQCPMADTVSLEYVMASEEFNEFVGEGANDVFGFSLNGDNIATIPGSGGLPVSISNINCGNPYDPNSSEPNCGLFINNDIQDGGGSINIEADGLTTVLTATGDLLPGNNHMKFAVGDVLDEAFDTWLFLKAGSFQCQTMGGPELVTTTFLSVACTAFQGANQFANEDILALDEETNSLSVVFDGSDVGLKYANVDAFSETLGDDLLLSITKNFNVSGLGVIDDADIIRFVPSALGDDTAGSFEMFFDGSANGLTGQCSDINAFQFQDSLPTGTDDDGDGLFNEQDPCPLDPQNDIDGDGLCGNVELYFSFTSSQNVNGVWYADEDIVVFNEVDGSYAKYFDGSDVGLGHADVDAFKLLDDGSLLLSFICDTEVPGVGLVKDEDVVIFYPTSIGISTAGAFELYLDSSETGLTGNYLDVNAIGQKTEEI